ncbi:MAG: Holliday junction branch migration DNA helicase RuvB [Dehalococcoidia bacterium]|nr:MAG: Holliday junction branch migration DNA helicase RuvB [Dehalococcoidia bacterium]
MRLVSGKTTTEDGFIDSDLRPRRLSEFIGQERIKDNLKIAIVAAQKRGEPLDHVILYGSPGLGKTTLAYIIAAEMGVNIKVSSGPAIERPGDLAAMLTTLHEGDVLFIDEMHRLSHTIEEKLYPAMEDFVFDIFLGKGPSARNLRLNLPRFTLIGATTRFALVSPPLRDRFGVTYHLDFYDEAAIQTILQRSTAILKVEAEQEGLVPIAQRARGTPRVANRLLKRTRDYAQVMAAGVITNEVALEGLSRLEIDSVGLDDIDHRVLQTIIDKFDGGPVGLDTIAASINEDAETIMDVYEPYLLQLAFLERTPRGRVATRLAYEHLGLPYKRDIQPQPGLWNQTQS